MKLTLTLKPSLLGQYYDKQCDKFLVYHSMDDTSHKKMGWPQSNEFKQTAATRAGNEWEDILLARLMEDESCDVINLKQQGKCTLEGTAEALKNLSGNTVYLYQACLGITPGFASRYLSAFGEGESNATFSSKMFPDFIRAEYVHREKKYRLTVIDAKNASILKIGAEIQISVYVLILKAIIEDLGIDNCFVNEEEGIVWNREKLTDNCIEHNFSLGDALAEVRSFFSDKIKDICGSIDSCRTGSQLQKKVDYRVSQKCEFCENYDICQNHCIDEENARLLPYITIEAQNRLTELIEEGVLLDDSWGSVKELLLNDSEKLTEDCSYWKRIKNDLEAYEKGLLSFYDGKKERFPKVGSSSSFPQGQNFSLMLTAQQDVGTGRCYAYAWYLRPGKGIDIWGQSIGKNEYVQIYEGKEEQPGKGSYYDSIVAESQSSEEFDRIDRVFVEKVYELLERISQTDDPRKRKLQIYVMDEYELKNIESTLYNLLETLDSVVEQELFEKVMTILFWIQGERLVTDATEQPEEVVDSPVAVLTSEISRLYVLSEGISYNLKQTSAIFSPDYNFEEDESNYFGVLTNVLEGTPVIEAWGCKDLERKRKRIESIGRHLRRRLFVEQKIVSAMQEDNRNGVIHVSAWPMNFYLQKPKYPEYPEIARLDFENRYEQLLTYHQIRNARMSGIDNAIDNGTILSLCYTGNGDSYEILNSENYVGREWFAAWLCEDTPENRMQIMLLRDTQYTSKPSLKYNPSFNIEGSVFYAIDFDHDYNFIDDGDYATVEFHPKKKTQFQPVKGKKYLFFEVYSDVNGIKTEEGIAKLVDKNNQRLLDPKALSGLTGIHYDNTSKSICSRYCRPDGHSFSPSQEVAFAHLLEQKLNVLVGPPASGKTDFISRSLITIASFYQETQGKKLKIMVTAMSHSAIDNVLLKLEKMLRKQNLHNIQIYKVGHFDDKRAFDGSSVILLDDSNKKAQVVTHTLKKDEIQIVGMTSWSAYKAFHDAKNGEMVAFDLIVMDEASQVRAMDAFLNLECSDENTQFLLVGDDDQLPPIIGGKYREVEGEKYIHGSIFRLYISGLGEKHPDIVRLSDNFRMNGILCKYPSKAIYGPDYKAFNEVIRTQKIFLKQNSKDDLMASILDEEYPLVFCELSGIAREQHDAEVQLVTQLISELWSSQMNPTSGNLASEDGNFWHDLTTANGEFLEGACGIISPHHEHINRLRTSISGELGLDRKEIFIGTVDKLQGKERKTVIVSYGVSEKEKITGESEFIFSRNRFNVSMTRGKAKTIIFLSDLIAEPNLTTNLMVANDRTLEKGVNFIHGFSKYIKNCEDGENVLQDEYDLGEVTLRVWKKRLLG